jgi:hypothetical protein
MFRIRHGSPVVALGLTLALLVMGACKKDEKKADPATGDTAAQKADGTAEKAMGGGVAMAVAAEDLSLLPLDSELVLGINVGQIQQSALWKQFVEPKMMTAETTKKLGEFKAKCGFDPMTAIKTVSVGLKGLANEKPDGVVVIHGVDKTKTFACLETMKAEMAADGTEYTHDGGIGMFKAKDGPPVALTFVNDSTAVAVLGEQANAAGVKAVTMGNSALKSSPPFLDMYSKVKTTDSLWGLMNGSSKVFDKMGSMGVKAKAMFGSLNVTDGLSLDLRLRLETPDAAAQLTEMSKQQMAQAAKMFDQIDVAASGSDVKYTIVLSNQKLQQLIAQFGPMLGAFSGMGGGGATP